MRRFRKPVMVKAIREFESPPLRFEKNVVGFTTHRRACQKRGGVALGKTAMIFKGFCGSVTIVPLLLFSIEWDTDPIVV